MKYSISFTLLLILMGCSTSTPIPPTAMPVPTPTPIPPKRALFVLQEHFNPSEYREPRTILEEKEIVITVAAPSRGTTKSYGGQIELEPDLVLGDVQTADYDIIVFVGGYPYDEDDTETQRIAREAVAENKVVAAICNAVIALAKAGVLEGKRVTSLQYHPASALESEGATLIDTDVERDGLIITGSGPGASLEFAKAIGAALDK
jgi:putative intracellular protease/amidase